MPENHKTKGRDRILARCRGTWNKKGSNPGAMPEDPKQKKGSNLGVMPENQKQNEGIELGRDAGELKTKQRDRIRARCRRTRIKTKGSNPGVMPENPKHNVGIESGSDAGELE